MTDITDAGLRESDAMFDLTDVGLKEQALSECLVREIGRDSHANGPCSHCLPRAKFYIALRDAARAEQREQDAKTCEWRANMYRQTRAPGWIFTEHEAIQCAAAIRAQGQHEAQ